MNGTVAVLTAIGALAALATLAGVIWAVLRTSALQVSNERLRNENEDYIRRLNYLEPKVEGLESRNRILEQMHNPAKAIGEIASQVADLAVQENANHVETLGVLTRIDKHLRGGAP